MKVTSLLAAIAQSIRTSRNPSDVLAQPEAHITAALDWILRAHQSTRDGGISKGYDILRGRWSPSYPETTGYTIPTLLNLAGWLQRPDLQSLALSIGDYLLDITTASGGVVHWESKEKSNPIVFDSGQVIFGWIAAYQASGEKKYLQAAEKAGDWLVSIQDPSGPWLQHQYLGVEKVIDTRVAWALLLLFQITDHTKYRTTAVGNLEWALRNQNQNGWFDQCAFNRGDDPFTHTIAYTAEGLLEAGKILGENRYIKAAQLTADALLSNQRSSGGLASTFGSEWQETSRSSCLTGNCQVGRLWLDLFRITEKPYYLEAAKKTIRFVAGTQLISTQNPDMRGGIAGSHPIYGQYERFKYPNWAAKFFIDALLSLEMLENDLNHSFYNG